MSIHPAGKGTRPTGLRIDYLTRPQLFAAAATAAVGIAAFLPWSSNFGLGVSGMHGQGRITLLCALAGLAVLAYSTDVIGRRTLTRQAYLIFSVPAVAMVLMTALRALEDGAGLGLYLTLLAGVAWAGALIWDVNERAKRIG